jgi:hypothetical protein
MRRSGRSCPEVAGVVVRDDILKQEIIYGFKGNNHIRTTRKSILMVNCLCLNWISAIIRSMS